MGTRCPQLLRDHAVEDYLEPSVYPPQVVRARQLPTVNRVPQEEVQRLAGNAPWFALTGEPLAQSSGLVVQPAVKVFGASLRNAVKMQAAEERPARSQCTTGLPADGGVPNAAMSDVDRVNALAILTGLAEESRVASIMENVLIPVHNASPHMEWIVEEAMMLTGDYEAALARMKQRYADQVNDDKVTKLAEKFGENRGTYNHAVGNNYLKTTYRKGGCSTDSMAGWGRMCWSPRRRKR